ncbi:FAD-binding oxidoreductase [Bradyrhizobium archetypum]|uniref:FAD-binding oxidoreductase n=1 Tax=Bradyrhizobium archetypum TaxID=2721160 RepID=A0A7Y4M5E8_9BRAD|nr:FAD-binding oxidoreductase [Bradyrhizobium archetypum]NOJ50833.1 FAD-binding oxidoreductase [Bradyrhizobium archetypum]
MNNLTKRTSKPVPEDVLYQLKEIVGHSGYLDDPAEIAPYCMSWRDNWVGSTPLVLRPASVDEVSRLVKVCASAGVPIVPQGGNTGLTGAGQPHGNGSEVIISTSRLRAIRDIDTLNDTITVESGVVLAEIQRRASEYDRLFPLSLGAEGTCQIGGNISTNAGGVQVFRYGSTRNLILGLEVVLPDGRVWDGLRALRKDNTGYDLKQLFIGGEGTLGVITAAVLRLFPKPIETQTALVAVRSPHAAVELLAHLRGQMAEHLSTFELMRRICIDAVIELIPGHGDPLATKFPWYVLMETTGQGPIGSLREPLEEALASALENGIADDVVIAESGEQRRRLWAIREDQGEVQHRIGTGIKHDVSIPVSRIAEFIERADAALAAAYPGIRHYAFGHVGDGNIHYNPIAPADWAGDAFARERGPINRIVHDIITDLRGSISAEHGIGQLRIEQAEIYKPAVELEMMRAIKRALDPNNLMNPGKILRL